MSHPDAALRATGVQHIYLINYNILSLVSRLQRLEESLSSESGISESAKEEKRVAHAAKETEFLRLKRSRLGVDDFVPLKVIGKGAFGEVRSSERLRGFAARRDSRNLRRVFINILSKEMYKEQKA